MKQIESRAKSQTNIRSKVMGVNTGVLYDWTLDTFVDFCFIWNITWQPNGTVGNTVCAKLEDYLKYFNDF